MAKQDLILLEDIMYYGRCYDGKQRWWYDLRKHSVLSAEELQTCYGWNAEDQLPDSFSFLPLFQTDMLQLQREFMKDYNAGTVEAIMAAEKVPYDTAFNIFVETPPELFARWKTFEKERLLKDAAAWCKKNHLPYGRKKQ